MTWSAASPTYACEPVDDPGTAMRPMTPGTPTSGSTSPDPPATNPSTTGDTWIAYHFTVLRVVPHVHTGAFSNVGVVLHARAAEFLGMRAIMDIEALRSRAPDVDTELLLRYLHAYDAICRGDERAGPIALVPPSERFHWISAPRSDVLQPAPVHEGMCRDPRRELETIFREYV